MGRPTPRNSGLHRRRLFGDRPSQRGRTSHEKGLIPHLSWYHAFAFFDNPIARTLRHLEPSLSCAEFSDVDKKSYRCCLCRSRRRRSGKSCPSASRSGADRPTYASCIDSESKRGGVMGDTDALLHSSGIGIGRYTSAQSAVSYARTPTLSCCQAQYGLLLWLAARNRKYGETVPSSAGMSRHNGLATIPRHR